MPAARDIGPARYARQTVALCGAPIFSLQRRRWSGVGRTARVHPTARASRLIILGVLSSPANRVLDHAKFSKTGATAWWRRRHGRSCLPRRQGKQLQRYPNTTSNRVRFCGGRAYPNMILRSPKATQNTEFILGCFRTAFRALTGRNVTPTTVAFSHNRNSDLREFERFFGCRVEFGANTNLLAYRRRPPDSPSQGRPETSPQWSLFALTIWFTPTGSALRLHPPPSSRLEQRNRARRRDRMAALTSTPVLPEAIRNVRFTVNSSRPLCANTT